MPLRALLVTAVSMTASPVAAVPTLQMLPAVEGRVLFARDCAGCHGMTGEGNGPEAEFLSDPPANLRSPDILGRYDDEELAAFIRDGRRLRLAVRPERLRRHADDTQALYEFLRRIPERDWDAVEAGEEIYIERCLHCHDRFGRPVDELPAGVQRAPRDLGAPEFQAAVTDAALIELVRHGKGSMPALVPRVSEEDARDLAPFVRVLSPGFELYVRHCQVCHGSRGQGAEGLAVDAGAARIPFDEAYFARQTPNATRLGVWHMLEGAKPTMPHFSYALTEGEVKAILTYLRSLPPVTSPPPRPPAASD
jgi:mono/diheme cytochrome c family protein